METKVQGPASYFPAIEAKYGRSIDEWKTLMRDSGLTSHKEVQLTDPDQVDKELLGWLRQAYDAQT